MDFGDLIGDDGVGSELPLDFGELVGPAIGVGDDGVGSVTGGTTGNSVSPFPGDGAVDGSSDKKGVDAGAELPLDFGELTGAATGVGALGLNGIAEAAGAALPFDFGELTGTVIGPADVIGAALPFDFGDDTGADVVVGTTGAGVPGVAGDMLGEPGVGSVIGVVTGASVSSGVTGAAVGAGTVGATGDGGSIEIWKLYSSESWHISPLGGVACAVTDAEYSAALHVLMLNDRASDVPSPGLIGLISRSPSRSVATPLKIISSSVTVMSTVPTLVMLTLYSRVSKHEMDSSSRSHDSTRNAPNSLVRLRGTDPDVSITLR